MADLFVGPVMEKLIDACFAYLKDQARWQTGMEEELQKLRVINPQIQAVLSAYSQVEIKEPNLNKWLWQLRDAIDEADDVLDEFDYRKLEEQVSKNSLKSTADVFQSVLEIGKRFLKIDPKLKRLEEAVHKLYKIAAEVSNFLYLLDRAKQEQQLQQLELHKTRETGSMPTNDLFGRRMEMEFVRQWLRKPYQTEISNTDLYSKISLLSVVGLGGMGKTTLLQHVYEDEVTKEFDVKMWACVSDNLDVQTVITNILKSLKKQVSNKETLEELQRSLQTEVMSKRFLLVLDDIWEANETKWKNVLAPLHYGSLGSKILITTRMDSVASMFAKMFKKSKESLPLKGLEEDECLHLFITYALAGVENPDDEFRSIARKMVEKLLRCPLAAKVIGGILNSYVDKCYWTKVLNTNIGNVEPGENNLLPILKLSYIYLSKSLQNCFAFCCIFPQDHVFDKDDLVKMWIALSFIQSSDIQGETLEDTGRRYFDILVRKSFFDEFHTDGKVYYKMHDLLHELAQAVSTQLCFRVVPHKELRIPETIRHLSIDARSLKEAFEKMGKFKNLRSLFLSFTFKAEYDENVISEILKTSKNIRLLAISAPYHWQKLPEMIGCLIHLRYLKFECLFPLKLPRSISHLYHLQFIISKTFEIDELVIKELMPNDNCELIMDEVAIKDPYVLLMEQLGSRSSFRSLTIRKNDELVSFPSETEQWFMQHSSSLIELTFNMLQSLQSLPSFLESLSSLNTLRVYNVPKLKLLPNPPASLITLELCNLESLQCLPSFLSTFSSINFLELKNIPLLKSLPDLTSSLINLDLEELESFQCPPSSFLTLSSLIGLKLFYIPLLQSLPDLPSSLEYLELEALQCIPSSLSNFSSLRYVRLRNIPLQSLPDLPSSLEYLELEALQCIQSSLSNFSSLQYVRLRNIPLLESLPDLPLSLKELKIEDLESLQSFPASLSAISSMEILKLKNIPLLKSLPYLPFSLRSLFLEELENLDCLPFCLPTIRELIIKKVPGLLELPYLPPFLFHRYIIDCHPLLMERYPNFLTAV